ncbi:MAG: hypothetical protein IJZ29_01965 [Clostridia bacterium]|nr:hypothetical protein [Clostridia bacterium]
MKQIKGLFCIMVIMLIAVITASCFNGVLCWADNSVTQTNNIDVKVNQNSKKAFTYGVDSEERIAKFGEFGELTQINIKISGETSLDSLKSTTTAVDENGEIVSSDSDASYFTDFIKIKIRLPKGYVKVNMLDGKGAVEIDKAKQVEDEYFKMNVEWVRLDKNKTSANLVVDENEEDRYLFFEFIDKNDNSLAQYFVRLVFDVEIK